MKRILLLALLVSLVSLPTNAFAARMLLLSDVGTAAVGDVVAVRLMLDPEGESVNGIEGEVLLSRHLRLVRIEYGHSPIALWLIRPRLQGEQKVEFAGILPGGYLGDLSATWKGYRAGELLVLYAEVLEAGKAEATLGTTLLTRNDGEGSAVAFSSKPLALQILSALSGRAPEAALPEGDSVPPSPFDVKVIKDQAVFDGSYAVIFNAQDEESGVAYYEIAEARSLLAHESELLWKRTESPALLGDQFLTSNIYVRAVDYAGNVRTERLAPSFTPVSDLFALFAALTGILLVLAVFRRMRRSQK